MLYSGADHSVNNACMNAVQLCTHYLHYMSSKIDWHFIMYLCIVCAQELVDPSIDITKSADCDDAWCDSCDLPNINR